MLPDATIDSAAEKLAEFRNNNALNDILDQYAVLIEDYKRLKSDYEEEREGRERYKQLARGQERNPFALVVVDGDGYIFDERFVKDGEEGGSRAAKQLNDTIKDSLRRKGLESCEVMVRVYANLTGLSKALCKNGLAGAEKRSFSSFTAGFNRSYGLADFIDAGELKENADFKVKAILRLYADNAQCKHIYFAACHDVGYVSDLISFRGNRERFTLIRTPSVLFHKEFDRLGMNVEELPGVFRHVSLTYAYSTAQTKTALASSTNISKVVSASYTNSTIKGNSNNGNSVCSFYVQGNCLYGSGCKFSHVDSKASSQNSTPSPSTIGTNTKNLTGDWRRGPNITKSNIESLPRKKDIPDGYVAINAVDDRLDAYLPPPDPDATRRLKMLSQDKRFCNNAQLYNSCESDNCGYEHAPIDKELLPALEHLSRSAASEVTYRGHKGAWAALTERHGHIWLDSANTLRPVTRTAILLYAVVRLLVGNALGSNMTFYFTTFLNLETDQLEEAERNTLKVLVEVMNAKNFRRARELVYDNRTALADQGLEDFIKNDASFHEMDTSDEKLVKLLAFTREKMKRFWHGWDGSDLDFRKLRLLYKNAHNESKKQPKLLNNTSFIYQMAVDSYKRQLESKTIFPLTCTFILGTRLELAEVEAIQQCQLEGHKASCEAVREAHSSTKASLWKRSSQPVPDSAAKNAGSVAKELEMVGRQFCIQAVVFTDHLNDQAKNAYNMVDNFLQSDPDDINDVTCVSEVKFLCHFLSPVWIFKTTTSHDPRVDGWEDLQAEPRYNKEFIADENHNIWLPGQKLIRRFVFGIVDEDDSDDEEEQFFNDETRAPRQKEIDFANRVKIGTVPNAKP
ncbi:hypothetical protein ACKLNR_014541 [Fusarium oxysporum f. sp. zingiberi]